MVNQRTCLNCGRTEMKKEKEPILARIQSMFVGKVSRNRENPFKKKKIYMTAELYFLMTVDSHFLFKNY